MVNVIDTVQPSPWSFIDLKDNGVLAFLNSQKSSLRLIVKLLLF